MNLLRTDLPGLRGEELALLLAKNDLGFDLLAVKEKLVDRLPTWQFKQVSRELLDVKGRLLDNERQLLVVKSKIRAWHDLYAEKGQQP